MIIGVFIKLGTTVGGSGCWGVKSQRRHPTLKTY